MVLAFGLIAGVAGAVELKINFQSNGAPIPEGYLPDYGEIFGDRGNGWSYGWQVDVKDGARDRNSSDAPDQRYDTINHLQKDSLDKIWEIELPNGTYNLFMVCGDAEHTDQMNNFDIEGVVMEDPDGTAGTDFDFDEFEVTVELTDGRLTIQPAEGADNCKICFVHIESDALTQFFSKARDPEPADGAVGVVDPLIMWTAGVTAVSQRVYFGTNPDDLAQVSEQVFSVYWHFEGIESGTRYYWRIDGVDADGAVITGDVWSFVAQSQTAWGPSPADGRHRCDDRCADKLECRSIRLATEAPFVLRHR